jgi:hypothetical protein
LISVAFLAVPEDDWFRPWQYRLSVAAEVAKSRAVSSRSALSMPQICATLSGVQSRTVVFSASKPLVCAAM